MKVRAHREKCSGHARCAAVAPEVFGLDDEGYTAIEGDVEIAPEDEKMARRGVRACPERALEIIED